MGSTLTGKAADPPVVTCTGLPCESPRDGRYWELTAGKAKGRRNREGTEELGAGG